MWEVSAAYKKVVPFAQVVGWDSTGAIEFNGAICSENTAGSRGGCFYGTGKGVITNGTIMESNEGGYGGAICE